MTKIEDKALFTQAIFPRQGKPACVDREKRTFCPCQGQASMPGYLDKEKLSILKYARVDSQQGKCGKDVIDLVNRNLSRKIEQEKLVNENCKGKLVDQLNKQ